MMVQAKNCDISNFSLFGGKFIFYRVFLICQFFKKKDLNPFPNALCSVYVWISKDGFSQVKLGLVKLGQVRFTYTWFSQDRLSQHWLSQDRLSQYSVCQERVCQDRLFKDRFQNCRGLCMLKQFYFSCHMQHLNNYTFVVVDRNNFYLP